MYSKWHSSECPSHAKALQQLGWLFHSNVSVGHQEIAINYLMRSIDTGIVKKKFLLNNRKIQMTVKLGICWGGAIWLSNSTERHTMLTSRQCKNLLSWCYKCTTRYRDGRNPTFWCSIGVLYYQINQV